MYASDADASGGIELDEFRRLYEDIRSYQERNDDVYATFRRFDADNSGDIDRYELRECLSSLGVDCSTGQAAQVPPVAPSPMGQPLFRSLYWSTRVYSIESMGVALGLPLTASFLSAMRAVHPAGSWH